MKLCEHVEKLKLGKCQKHNRMVEMYSKYGESRKDDCERMNKTIALASR